MTLVNLLALLFDLHPLFPLRHPLPLLRPLLHLRPVQGRQLLVPLEGGERAELPSARDADVDLGGPGGGG